jgi:hypothetical protein
VGLNTEEPRQAEARALIEELGSEFYPAALMDQPKSRGVTWSGEDEVMQYALSLHRASLVAEAQGSQPYLVDNSFLQASTKGIGLRMSTALADMDEDVPPVAWGAVVHGTLVGEEWVQVTDATGSERFMPVHLDGVAVLVPVDDPGTQEDIVRAVEEESSLRRNTERVLHAIGTLVDAKTSRDNANADTAEAELGAVSRAIISYVEGVAAEDELAIRRASEAPRATLPRKSSVRPRKSSSASF